MARYNVEYGKWGEHNTERDLTDTEVVIKLQSLILSDTKWISIISHHSNSMVYIDLDNLRYGEAIGAIGSKNFTKIFTEIRNPFNVNGIDTFGEYVPSQIVREKPIRKRAKNWKHTTKNRKAFMKNCEVWMPDYYGDWKEVNRKGAKMLDKHNTPFMQDEFDTELVTC